MTASALVKNPDLKCMAKIRRATACLSRSKSTAKLSGLPPLSLRAQQYARCAACGV
jgi:hypothetical protein